MYLKQLLFVFFILFLFSSCVKEEEPMDTDNSSDFLTDDGGWRITGDAQGVEVIPEYDDKGGVIGGHICATDNVTGGTWYFEAPSKYYGDRSDAYGNVLTFNLKQNKLSSQFDGDDIVLESADLSIAFDTSMNPDTTWTEFEVPLNASANWFNNTIDGTPASEADIRLVLSNVTAFRIRGEFVVGSDRGCLDLVDFPGVE